MIEKIIYLEGIDPLVIYGINNKKLEKITSYFPKLKIIGRGNEIKAIGSSTDILEFEKRIDLMIEFYQRCHSLSLEDIDRLILDSAKNWIKEKEDSDEAILFGNSGKPVKAKTINQRKLVEDFDKKDLLFAVGPAGSGKTYTAIALAVRALKNREIKRIVLTRPAVEAGESLGFLPGDYKSKLDPYLRPLYDALNDMIPPKKLAEFIEENVVEIAPLAFMRGRTLDNACVILDEAQNTTKAQFKMFLTRMGKNAKFMVTGDITQIDLPKKHHSGLLHAMNILDNIHGISIIKFDQRDIIRHSLVKYITRAYEDGDEKAETQSNK